MYRIVTKSEYEVHIAFLEEQYKNKEITKKQYKIWQAKMRELKPEENSLTRPVDFKFFRRQLEDYYDEYNITEIWLNVTNFEKQAETEMMFDIVNIQKLWIKHWDFLELKQYLLKNDNVSIGDFQDLYETCRDKVVLISNEFIRQATGKTQPNSYLDFYKCQTTLNKNYNGIPILCKNYQAEFTETEPEDMYDSSKII
tara:strand:+ start:68 stop:661 length:594 start_codon:yes stop_codon:yes gene_type:complete